MFVNEFGHQIKGDYVTVEVSLDSLATLFADVLAAGAELNRQSVKVTLEPGTGNVPEIVEINAGNAINDALIQKFIISTQIEVLPLYLVECVFGKGSVTNSIQKSITNDWDILIHIPFNLYISQTFQL